MKAIKFKAVYLNAMMKRLIIILGALIILFFLISNLHWSYKYCLSMLVLFGAMLYMFYENRNELILMQIDGTIITFSFVNNSFFKRKDMTLSINEISCAKEKKLINLFAKEKLFAIIRKESIGLEEWEYINSFYCKREGDVN